MQSEAENREVSATDSESENIGGGGARPSTSEMIERFKRFYGLRFDTAVARKLGLSDGSAIGNWRRRDSIDLLLIAEYCPEINIDWLVWGRGTRTPPPAEDRTDLPNTVLYLQEMGVPREQIIMLVNEALESYLGGKKKQATAEQTQDASSDNSDPTSVDDRPTDLDATSEEAGQ